MSTDSLMFSSAGGERRVYVGLAIWAAAAVAVAQVAAQVFLEAPAVVPATIWGTVFGALAVWRLSPSLRAFTRSADLRLPILWHVVRVPFGVSFLVLAARGELPPAFAWVAGPGDIAAGLLAIPAALMVGRRPRLVLAWNALALADILAVMVTAMRIIFSPQVTEMAAFPRFPFNTLPFVVVPLIVLTHLWVFARRGR